MTGFEGIGDFDSDDPWQRYIAHQAAKGNYPSMTEDEIDATIVEIRDMTDSGERMTVEELVESQGFNMEDIGAPRCPNCGRIMSNREYEEQRCCNDCLDGTIPWQHKGDW